MKNMIRQTSTLICAAALLAALLVPPARAAEDYPLHVVIPMTGNAAFLGQSVHQTLTLLEGVVNKDGGVAGRNLHLVFHDDQSSPQTAVQLTGEILATHPAAVLGSAIVAMCNAMAPLMRDGPVHYCFSPGVHPAPGSYVFSAGVSTRDLLEAQVRFFRLKGWTRLAMLSSTDATGQDIDRSLDEVIGLPENHGVTIVEHGHFAPGATSVSAQIERIKAADPQAFIAWTTGAAIGLVFRAALQAGLEIPIATTNGNQYFQAITQFSAFLPKQLYFPSAPFPEHAGVILLDPRVEAVQQEFYAALKGTGMVPDNEHGSSWDALLVVVDALRKLGPNATAAQIKNHIAGLTEFPGINGLYDYKAVPQRGIGLGSAVITVWSPDHQRWEWVSKPGGEPLS